MSGKKLGWIIVGVVVVMALTKMGGPGVAHLFHQGTRALSRLGASLATILTSL